MENSSQYFVELFASATRQKRLELLRKIAAIKDENALQFLISCFADEFWVVRKAAADIVKDFGDAAVPALSGAINSYNQDVQHGSLMILG